MQKIRICKGCGGHFPQIELYVGITTHCKPCWREKVRKNREKLADYYIQYDKARAMRPDRIEARRAYAQTENGKEHIALARKAWQVGNPERRAAHIKVSNAIRDGKLIKAPCEVCGSQVSDAHHDDYSKPLDIRWLCKTHHGEHHKMLRLTRSGGPVSGRGPDGAGRDDCSTAAQRSRPVDQR